ncbi:MAG: hypothetical protein Q4F09_05195 [Erysipelotrichaceae bacterium]|nr:hypothetical protein [Erysipelotrichaceae bacterium]
MRKKRMIKTKIVLFLLMLLPLFSTCTAAATTAKTQSMRLFPDRISGNKV